jgi:hypothetical protein
LSVDSFQSLKGSGTFLSLDANGGLQFFSREWLFKVHGYDERFNLWGGIDNEIVDRACYDSKCVGWLSRDLENIYLVHLQHPKWELPGLTSEQIGAYKRRNNRTLYLKNRKAKQVIVNLESWGQECNVIGPRYTKDGIVGIENTKALPGRPLNELEVEIARTWKDGVSIVVLSYLRFDCVIRCLESLFANSRNQYEIILIEQSNAPEFVKKIQTQFPSVRVFPFEKNMGVAKSQNLAAHFVSREYVLFLDNDCYVEANWDIS